jgi:hypothetical protein
MNFQIYPHRYADIILNSDYDLRKEIEEVIKAISYNDVISEYEIENEELLKIGKKTTQGRQKKINSRFRDEFLKKGWEKEKSVFGDINQSEQDLKIDFFKRRIAVDVAFNHRSFIGGDLLRLQAAAEVTNIIKAGVYICATKNFIKKISPKDGNSLVSFERTEWYLQKFYPVITVPILLMGLVE